MTTALAVVRAVHLATLIGLVGSLAFSLLVLRAPPTTAGLGRDVLRRCDATLVRTAWWCTLGALASALAWLALYTAAASGGGLAGALDPDSLTRVLTSTSFGSVWVVRIGLLVLTGALLLLQRWERDARDWAALRGQCLALGAAVLAVIAWTGHLATAEDLPWGLSPAVDAVHIVAPGIWLGGLLALSQLLALAAREPAAGTARSVAEVARRFSTLALAAVATLMVTGAINAWVLVGDVASLVGTPYGQLLLVKLALLIPLLGLGAINRWRMTPRLLARAAVDPQGSASRLIHGLRRTVAAEAGLGACVLLVVGALGVTPPARHVDPWWPFPIRLSWAVARDDPATPLWLLGGALYAAAGLAALGYARRRGITSRWLAVAAGGGVAYGAILGVSAFPVIDAYPTTYLRSSVPYQAVSIARGAELYARHCAVCHGPSGQGDGPAAQTLPRRPADLTARHAADHTAGDLYWWLSHGIPRGGMPGFQGVMSETDRWDAINYVRALAAGERARSLGPRVGPLLFAAPDFGFGIGVGAGETLRDQRGGSIVHLVLFTLPESVPRLEQLDRAWTKIGLAGARIIAVPMRQAEDTYRHLGTRVINPSIAVEGSEEIVTAYMMLAQPAPPLRPPVSHVEFLIDRQGWLRARWIPESEPGWSDVATLLDQVQRLGKEAPFASPPEDHVH